MKITLSLFLAILVLISISTNVFATASITENGDILNETVAGVIDSQLTYAEKQSLYDIDNSLSNKILLKVYPLMSWDAAGQSMEELIARSEKLSSELAYQYYYILSDKPYRISAGKGQMAIIETSETPQYIKDIISLPNQVVLAEKQFDITGVYCIDGSTSHDGITVCITTQAEALIKYYEFANSEAMCFSEQEFCEYASRYYAHITSYENNYNENGEPLAGHLSFKSFVESVREENNNSSSFFKRNSLYLWLGFGIILATGVVITGYSIYKKRHNT